MRVLIVGAAGFIGCAAVRALETAGISVRLADTQERLLRCDDLLGSRDAAVFDFSTQRAPPELFDGVDSMIHLGYTTNPAHSMEAMAFDAGSNIGPSIQLFEAASQAGVRRVVFSSSGGTVYGAPAELPVRERAPTDPLSAYGVSKLAIEKYLAICPGVEGISLRVANPYGGFQLRGATVGVIARYLLAVRRGESLEVWGDGSVVRDYIAIDDVARAFAAAVSGCDVAPGAYNVGSGIGASIADIIELIFRASGKTVPVNYLPARGYDVPAIVLDSSRFSDQTGWQAQTGLADGIAALWQQVIRAG